MKKISLLALMLAPSFAHAGVLSDACSDQIQAQNLRLAKIQQKLTTCHETSSNPMELTCPSYRRQQAETKKAYGIVVVFQNRFSNTVSDQVEYDCSRNTLRGHRIEYRGATTADTFGSAKISSDFDRNVAIETAMASYQIRLIAGTGVSVTQANLNQIAVSDVLSSSESSRLPTAPVVLENSSVSRYQNIVKKNYGPKIGAAQDHFSGFGPDESSVTVAGVKSVLDPERAALNIGLLYSLTNYPNNVNVSDADYIFGQQRDYREFLRELSAL